MRAAIGRVGLGPSLGDDTPHQAAVEPRAVPSEAGTAAAMPGSVNRAVPYTEQLSSCGCGVSVASPDGHVQRVDAVHGSGALGANPEERAWPTSQPACSCVLAVASRCCCAATATMASATAAGHARAQRAAPTSAKPAGAINAAPTAASSTPRVSNAGASDGASGARSALSAPAP